MALFFFFSCSRSRSGRPKKEEDVMRIADILTEEMEEEEVIDTQKKRRGILFYNKKTSCSPTIYPRSLLARWLSRRKSDSGRPVAEPDRVATGERNSETIIYGGGKHEDHSFNLGMGIGLICLLAKSATEVNKMIELRAQMEMLLKEVRAEVRAKDAIAISSESNNILISPTQCFGEIKTSMDLWSASSGSDMIKHAGESESQSNYVTALGNTRSMSIDQMEAELEVELELLQTNLEGESSSAHQHRKELDNEKDDPCFESFSVNYDEDDIIPKDTQEFHGVSAHELERRLHNLLAARQKKQIEELQTALECMEKRLLEKEMELHCCKLANCFVLQNEEEMSNR